MRTRVQKWGNSLAVRIPRSFAGQIGLQQDSAVDLQIVEGKVVIEPVTGDEYSLDELLSGVTSENRHGEIDSGPAFGAEAW